MLETPEDDVQLYKLWIKINWKTIKVSYLFWVTMSWGSFFDFSSYCGSSESG
jgi:hypothetical protein